MRLFIVAILAIFAYGCTVSPVKVNIPKIKESSVAQIEDLRPAAEKKNELFSFSIFSEAYGTYRRGDELIDPNPVRVLQHRAYEKLSSSDQPIQIKVNHFVVYMNLQSELKRSATGAALGGIIGAAIASGTQKYGVDGIATIISQEEFESHDEEYKRAFYTAEENPDKVSVYNVYLEAEVNGKSFFVKTMTPTRLPEDDKRNSHIVAVETAIAFFLDQFNKEENQG